MACVQTIDCSTADEFLSKITLSGPPPERIGYDLLLFRGVANGAGPRQYKLVPSALRLDNFDTLARLAGSSVGSGEYRDSLAAEEWAQEALEASVIGSFFRFADIQGLSLPEVGTDVRQAMQLPSTASSLFYRESTSWSIVAAR